MPCNAYNPRIGPTGLIHSSVMMTLLTHHASGNEAILCRSVAMSSHDRASTRMTPQRQSGWQGDKSGSAPRLSERPQRQIRFCNISTHPVRSTVEAISMRDEGHAKSACDDIMRPLNTQPRCIDAQSHAHLARRDMSAMIAPALRPNRGW